MSDEMEKFKEDPRPACKYSEKCYQRNPDHIKKFKHPPKPEDTSGKSPPRKMARLSVTDKEGSKSPQTPAEKKRRSSSEKHRNTLTPQKERNTPVASPVSAVDSSSKSPDSDSAPVTGLSIPEDVKKNIKDKFLVEMPEDFYSFWEFCKSISKDGNIKNVFKAVNLFLVGPFDVLLESLPERENESDYLVHWRYYYDPPEFQTILMTPDSVGFHLGYFRDSLDELPCFVASNESEKSCKISPVAENIFGAVLVFLENARNKSPFISIPCQKLITQLKEWATKHTFTLETSSAKMKKRKVAVVSNTFHGAGIVVPFDKKTQVGYRPLIETDAKLKILIQNVVDSKTDKEREAALAVLQPVITYANIATDECDFGGGLELGLDFFCTGEKAFHTSVKQLLGIAYTMLNRSDFEKILNAHLSNRRKGSKLSCADL